MARFEWDESKRLRTIRMRNPDFLDAPSLFDGRSVVTLPAKSDVELRLMTVGRMQDGKIYTVIWTQRADARRIITFRRARHDEERAYHADHG